MHAALLGPTKHGSQPFEKSFLELKNDELHVSAVKKSENGEGWVVRLFNPLDTTIKSSIHLNEGYTRAEKVQSPIERVMSEFELPKDKGHMWTKIRKVTIEEVPVKDFEINKDGWVDFEIGKKEILTIEFQ